VTLTGDLSPAYSKLPIGAVHPLRMAIIRRRTIGKEILKCDVFIKNIHQLKVIVIPIVIEN
jgi:hypothetical protein